MKKWQKTATSILTLSMAGVIVAGCGTSNTSTAQPSQSTSKKATAMPTGQTITIWSWQTGAQLTDMEKIAQTWAKKHQDTVKVVDQSKNASGFQFYATAARTGKGPDVVFGMPHDNNGLFAQEGLIAPVPSGLLNSK